MTYKEQHEELRGKYKNLEKRVLEAKANKKVSEQGRAKVEKEIKKLLKRENISPDVVEAFLLKLEKEVESRMDILSEKLQEYEGTLSEFKSEEPKNSNNILEDL